MDNSKIDAVLQELKRLAYPPRDGHSLRTQVFHDAMEVINHLRNQLERRCTGTAEATTIE